MAAPEPNLARYLGHLSVPEVGLAGQRALSRASVLCVGTGGLGSPAALYLAAAGVGRIGLLDSDQVDASNLQRQVLYRTPDVGQGKAELARATLAALNPEIDLVPHAVRLTAANAADLLAGYDVILDGSDNFPTRYLVNDTCVKLGKPDVWASVFRFEGQVAVFDARHGPCYRCLFPAVPAAEMIPSCAEAGVLGVLPGILGTMQALEAIKLIVGVGRPLTGRLLVFDGLSMGFTELELAKDPACPACGEVPVEATPAGPLAPRGPVPPALDPQDLEPRLGEPGLQLIDCREAHEWPICHLPGSRLMPLGELPSRAHELDRTKPVVLVCHRGPRAYHAAAWLMEAGFADVAYLDGGLNSWSLEVDPAMPRY